MLIGKTYEVLRYSTRLNGMFTGTDTITPVCAMEYTEQLENEASKMINKVNKEMGHTVCISDSHSAVTLEPSVTFTTQENQVYNIFIFANAAVTLIES